MNVIAVDTGKTAGVAQWHDGEFQAWQLPGWEAVDLIHEWTAKPDLLVIERLTIQQRSVRTKGEVLTAVEQLGALRYWQMQHPEVELDFQNPADAMTFGTDDKLRRADFWVPGKEHARDAARHLLLALVKRNLFPDAGKLIG